jgi:hypothetical protein
MFKKNKVAIISLAILLLVAVVVYFSNRSFTLDKSEAIFTISDTSAISKIKVTNGDSTFVLTKTNGNWVYNNSIPANPELMSIIFRIFTQIEIKSALPKASLMQVAEIVNSKGSDVEVFSDKNVLKHYKIFANPAMHRIFMCMYNSKKPYEVTLPSFQGNFAGVFKATRRLWHNRAILNVFTNTIGSVKVVQYTNAEKSFELIINEKGQPIIKTSKQSEIHNISKEALDAYFYCLKRFRVETYAENTDSLMKIFTTQKPVNTVAVTDLAGTQVTFDLYAMQNKENSQLALNYCYLLINKKEVAIAKYIETDPITRDVNFFIK